MDRRMASERLIESKHKELTNFTSTQQKQASENRNETLMQGRRRENVRAQVAAEQMFEFNVEKENAQSNRRARDAQQNGAIAQELLRRRAQDERAEREIQRICEESEMLKDLETRLKVAYTNKERAAQLDEKAFTIERDSAAEQAICDQMEFDRQQALREMESNEITRREHMVQGRYLLQDQMASDNYHKMMEAAQAAEGDNELVRDVMRKIEEEDYREYTDRQNKIQETVDAIEAYKQQRADELLQARMDAKAAEDKILKYAQAKGAREATIKEQQDQRKAEEESRFKAIELAMRAKAEEEEEFGRLRDMVWEEETEARLRKLEQDKASTQEMAKQEMMLANEQQKALKKHIAGQQRAEDDELKRLTLQKFEEDVRLDMEAQDRREGERLVYQQQIVDQKIERRQMYQMERDAEVAARQRLEEEEQFKARVVEEARRRLLAEHAPHLAGFLPKGALQTANDLSYVREYDPASDAPEATEGPPARTNTRPW
jgi:hypothetical protein